MEPSKMDNQFRKQLNEREIQPSEAAWDRLDAMLSIAEKKKRKFPWMYIAASVLGFLLIGTVFFNGFTLEINKDTPLVLEHKKDGSNLRGAEMINEDFFPGQIHKKSIETHKVIADNKNLKKEAKQLKDKEEEVLIVNQSKENNAIVNSFENKNNQSTSKNKYVSGEKLLAEVGNTKFEPKVTDIAIEKTRKGISIDPNSLLSNAETELNQSFRESALDRLNKNFNAIKTVLANRNYQE